MTINPAAIVAGSALAVTVMASAVVLISSSPMRAIAESSDLWPGAETSVTGRAWGTPGSVTLDSTVQPLELVGVDSGAVRPEYMVAQSSEVLHLLRRDAAPVGSPAIEPTE